MPRPSLPSLCDCCDAYILDKGTIALVGITAADIQNKKAIIKHFAPFTDCKSKQQTSW